MTSLNEAILDNLFSAVLVLDETLTVCYANPSAEQLFCLSLRRLQSAPLTLLLPHCKLNFNQIRQSLIHCERVIKSDSALIIDGQMHKVKLKACRFEHQHKTVILLELGLVERQYQLNQEAIENAQQEAARELIRGLAHEIKNPLGGLRGAAQLLEKMLPTAELREYTKLIINQADRLKNLVNRLLGPQKIGHRRHENIHVILEKARQLVQLDAPWVKISRDYDPSLPEIEMDPEQLEQAILNILNNAVFALKAQEDAHIFLRTRTEHQVMLNGEQHRFAVRIDIQDNGPGILKKLQDTLFFPMVSGNPEGTGLGLAITRNLIDQHKGKIFVTSEPKKTVFTILLPHH